MPFESLDKEAGTRRFSLAGFQSEPRPGLPSEGLSPLAESPGRVLFHNIDSLERGESACFPDTALFTKLLASRKFSGHGFAERGLPVLLATAAPESNIKFVGFVVSKKSL